MDNKATGIEAESSERELQRLLNWIKNNQSDWYKICNPESSDLDIEYLSNLVGRLYREKIYTIMYLVVFSSCHIRGMEQVINKTIHECLLDIPTHILVERLWGNIEAKAEALTNNEQEQE